MKTIFFSYKCSVLNRKVFERTQQRAMILFVFYFKLTLNSAGQF